MEPELVMRTIIFELNLPRTRADCGSRKVYKERNGLGRARARHKSRSGIAIRRARGDSSSNLLFISLALMHCGSSTVVPKRIFAKFGKALFMTAFNTFPTDTTTPLVAMSKDRSFTSTRSSPACVIRGPSSVTEGFIEAGNFVPSLPFVTSSENQR